MAERFSLSGAVSSLIRKNDLFLLLILIASLSLNVYLGWNVKRLRSASVKPEAPVKLPPGATALPVTATSLSGAREIISYADSDKPTVLYVFSPACIWCARNTESVNALASLKGDAFRFIGLSLADEGLPGYLESHGLAFPVYKGLTRESVEVLGLGTTPQTIVISPDGRVLQNWTGAFANPVRPEVERFFNVSLPGLPKQKN